MISKPSLRLKTVIYRNYISIIFQRSYKIMFILFFLIHSVHFPQFAWKGGY